MSRRSGKRVCVVLFFFSLLSCCKAFVWYWCPLIIFSCHVSSPNNRSTCRSASTVLHLAPTRKCCMKISGLVAQQTSLLTTLSPLFNIFLITVKIDFQSCLPQLVRRSWGFSCSHVRHRDSRSNVLLFCWCRFHRFQPSRLSAQVVNYDSI